MQKLRIVKRGSTVTIFNFCTGETIIDGDGCCDTPILLDVSLTTKCSLCCSYCYKKTSTDGYDMTMDDFCLLLKKMKEAKVFQVAYGGGNPNEHSHFIEILKMTYESNIIPNYSTNGIGMTDEIIDASNKYCGSVALSIHKKISEYQNLIEKMTNRINKVNIHFIMRKDNADEICSFLSNPPRWAIGINAIILLRYKKCGSYRYEEPSEQQYKKIFESCIASSFKIGFDACSYYLIKKYLPNVDKTLYDYCQGGRSSAFVDEHLNLSPCSFDKCIGEDLHNTDIENAFVNSPLFKRRRMDIIDNKVCTHYFYNDKSSI